MKVSNQNVKAIMAGAALMLLGAQESNAQEQMPNVLFFYIDDLGWTDLGVYGSEFYETPAIDQLAAEGLRFTSAYQAAARCVPSRTSLFTGKYHERPGIADSKGVVLSEYTFAEAFHDAGYHTFFAGKWHLGKEDTRWPDKQGFDVNRAGCNWGAPQGSTEGGGEYFSPYNCPTLSDGPEGEYLTDRLTRETIDFIENHQSTRPEDPFLACVFHYAVHTPIEAPSSYVDFYTEKLKTMEYDRPVKEIDGPAKTNLRHDHPVYAGMIASVDESVRRIRERLDDMGLSDNTIIVFSSDHGGLSTTLKSNGREIPTSNYPLRTGKGWLYEGGIRSPLIVYWPGITAGGVTDEPVVGTDIYPTLLDMAGLPSRPEQHLDGVSFAPLIRGEEWSREAPIMWYFPFAKTGTGNPNMAAIRMGDHKLIHFMEQDRFELYDLQNDLSESYDMYEVQPELAASLKQQLFLIEQSTDMPVVKDRLVAIERDEILPEYQVSLLADQLPEFSLNEMDVDYEDSCIIFRLTITEENAFIHPVDLDLFYRLPETQIWEPVTFSSGEYRHLFPGAHILSWKFAGVMADSIDIRIFGHIHNALDPEEIGELILKDVVIKKKEESESSIESDRLNDGLSIFPVPAGDYVVIRSREVMSHIELFDLAGICRFSQQDIDSPECRLNIAPLNPGPYILRISYTEANKQRYGKLIVANNEV